MALGTNLRFTGSEQRLWARVNEILGRRATARTHSAKRQWICTKNGAPASNTAADDPGRKGVFIIDEANNNLYLCTAYTNSTTFTLTQLN